MPDNKDTHAVHQLSVGEAFAGLSRRERLYAHHLARAAWCGARIILRQVSEEAIGIYKFIMELYASCGGHWETLAKRTEVGSVEMDAFLHYAATFLSNIGNYYGSGDQKFRPYLTADTLAKLASGSPRANELFLGFRESIFSIPPYTLGFPSDSTQSAYYPGPNRISKDEISRVSAIMAHHHIFPENTRLRKIEVDGQVMFDILQASIDVDSAPKQLINDKADISVQLVRGDHSVELKKICSHLSEASKFAANDQQKVVIGHYLQSFQTGDLEAYRDSQRIWVADRAPKVENIFGFVEPYRDPLGIRAEFEAIVAVQNVEESVVLKKLVDQSDTFIRRLPWANQTSDNNGKGHFEKALFSPPDFASIHTLAYCSSIIFGGINLPNYNDIRQECGFKNVMIANRMIAESQSERPSPFIDIGEAEMFKKHKFHALYIWVVLHELLGHGTGKLMMEERKDKYNFDIDNPPIDPLTGNPITSWYRPGQTWTGQFEDLATTVDECRAELVGAYLMEDTEILALFGFNQESEIVPDDLTYYFYLLLCTRGLQGLSNFNTNSNRWGQAHSRAHFAILRCLLADGDGVVKVLHDTDQNNLTVKVDRSRIASHGKPALGRMLLNLHLYRCTADVEQCRTYYGQLSHVDGVYLEWRKTVMARQHPGLNYVQPNTFIAGDDVELREYEASAEGIVRSWAERKV